MSTADTYVRVRIDTATKEPAAEALEAMGLSISDAIRLLMLRVTDERRLVKWMADATLAVVMTISIDYF